MSAESLRRKYVRQFVGLERYGKVTAWAIVSSYVLWIVLAVVAGHNLLMVETNVLTVPLVVVLMVFIGTRLRGLNNIVHECTHSSFVDDRQSNVTIGRFCASLILGSFTSYKHEHLSHHAHLGDYEHDLDLQGIEDLGLHDPLTPRTIFRHLLTPLTGRHLRYYLNWDLSREDGLVFQILKMGLLLGAVVMAGINPLTTILFILVPYVLVFSALNYWADCMDHAGLVPTGSDLDGSRNIVASSWVRWLFFPRQDCFHLVHHLFPNVPARHLQATHDLLKTEEEYRRRDNAVPEGGLIGAPGLVQSSNQA